MIAIFLNVSGCKNVLLWLRYSHDLVYAHIELNMSDVMPVLD